MASAGFMLAIGLAYRATFLNQGLAATDEGWLQGMGLRIAHGEVPYRDFDLVLPPVSIYKEAVLIWTLGHRYTMLASRWALAIEVTAGSLLAFLILRRFLPLPLAFLSSLPTIFFSVILYYFSNYNYDAEVLLLAAVALLIYTPERRTWLASLAGVAAGLAFLAKPTYGGFIVIVPLAGMVAARALARPPPAVPAGTSGIRRGWPFFLVGSALTVAACCGYFWATGALTRFLADSFLLTRQAHPTSLRFVFVQDLPSYLFRWETVLVVAVVILLAWPAPRVSRRLRLLGVAVLLALVLAVTFRSQPIDERPAFLVTAYGLLAIVNIAALVLAVRGHGPLPPELPLLALTLQYLAQISYAGVVFFYVGAFLSVPIALVMLWWLGGHPTAVSSRAAGLTAPRTSAAVLGLWLTVGSLLVTRSIVYEDGPRAELTASFQSPGLRGLASLPATVARIDGLVGAINSRSQPGDPIFVFPDLAILYVATDRTNPTRTEWFNPWIITTEMSADAVSALARNPPKVVLLQSHREWDFRRSLPALDYDADPKWRPLYQYLVAHFKRVGTVQDVDVLIPIGQPA